MKKLLLASSALWIAAIAAVPSHSEAANFWITTLPTYASCGQYTNASEGIYCGGYVFNGYQFLAWGSTCSGGCSGSVNPMSDQQMQPGRASRAYYETCAGKYVVALQRCTSCS